MSLPEGSAGCQGAEIEDGQLAVVGTCPGSVKGCSDATTRFWSGSRGGSKGRVVDEEQMTGVLRSPPTIEKGLPLLGLSIASNNAMAIISARDASGTLEKSSGPQRARECAWRRFENKPTPEEMASLGVTAVVPRHGPRGSVTGGMNAPCHR